VSLRFGDNMRLLIDTTFTIGRTHSVCEDYVIGGTDPIPHMILCDGCSTSRNTDVGARILAHSMKLVIDYLYSVPYPYAGYYLEKKQMVIRQANQVVDSINLNKDCLDATLITAVCIGNKVCVYMYGDGVILYRRKSDPDKIKYFKVDFYGNMPYYASYLLSDNNHKKYERVVKEGCDGMAITIESDEGIETRMWDSEMFFEFDLDETSLVAINSDGITQLTDINAGERLSVSKVAEEFLAFKNINGGFVKRRVKRALEDYGKSKIYPADDVSLGVFLNK
jgi:hypothetical protein